MSSIIKPFSFKHIAPSKEDDIIEWLIFKEIKLSTSEVYYLQVHLKLLNHSFHKRFRLQINDLLHFYSPKEFLIQPT